MIARGRRYSTTRATHARVATGCWHRRSARRRQGSVAVQAPNGVNARPGRGWALFSAALTEILAVRDVLLCVRSHRSGAGCRWCEFTSEVMHSQPLRFVHWAPDPVMLAVDGRPFTWYALLFVCGLLGGYAILVATFMRERIDITYANILLILVGVGAVVGARFGEVVFYEWPYYRAHPDEIVRIWHGGLASHGAVIGIALVLWFYARVVIRMPFLWVLDRVVPGIALAAACVRFGNLINSEILGKPTALPWAFVFERVDSTPRHPVQLYEGLAYLLLCVALIAISRRSALPEGCLTGLFLVGMFLPRWLLELTKDGRIVAGGMNMGQVLSTPLVIAGGALLAVSCMRGRRPIAPRRRAKEKP